MNRFEFFSNYKKFANHIRFNTSEVILAQLKGTKDIELQKTLMLRIVEELVASTEDLAMWLITLHDRNDGDSRFRDEWERILVLEISQDKPSKILLSFKRLKTTNGFLKKMDFPNLDQLSTRLKSDKRLVINAVDTILATISSAINTRSDNDGIVVRFHNKMKHGMMIYSNISNATSWIRDFSVKKLERSKRLSRKDRSFDIPVDIKKAERIVGTIKANSYGIEALINLLLIDYEYRFITRKIRVRKNNREKYLAEINKALGI